VNTPVAAAASEPSVVEEELRKISPDALTPKQALDFLYALKDRLPKD
jgi:DNA mismatch repair protein MutS